MPAPCKIDYDTGVLALLCTIRLCTACTLTMVSTLGHVLMMASSTAISSMVYSHIPLCLPRSWVYTIIDPRRMPLDTQETFTHMCVCVHLPKRFNKTMTKYAQESLHTQGSLLRVRRVPIPHVCARAGILLLKIVCTSVRDVWSVHSSILPT